jgi:truncated hemoglobin YjbI
MLHNLNLDLKDTKKSIRETNEKHKKSIKKLRGRGRDGEAVAGNKDNTKNKGNKIKKKREQKKIKEKEIEKWLSLFDPPLQRK